MCSSNGDPVAQLAEIAGRLAGDPAPTGSAAMEQVEEISRVIDSLEAAVAARVDRVDAEKTVRAHGYGSTSAWLRHACRMRAGRAAERTTLARQLRRLPDVAKRFASGELGFGHCTAIGHTVKHLSDEHAGRAEPILLELADRASAETVARAGGYLRRVLDPDGTLKDDDKAFERRWLSLNPLLDGRGHVEGIVDAELLARLKAALDPLAQPAGADDDRTQQQRNADALATLITGTQQTHMTVIVDLQTLAGGDLPACLGPTRQPITAADARRIAQNAGLSRLVTGTAGAGLAGLDTTGLDDAGLHGAGVGDTAVRAEAARQAASQAIARVCGPEAAHLLCSPRSLPLDVGRESRLVTPAIRRALAHAYPTCAVDGCDIPAYLCEADHIRPWVLDGRTAIHTMTLACAFHNRWRARYPDRVQTTRHPDGRVTYRIHRPGRWPP